MGDKLQPPKGTTDLMPDEMARHRHVIDTAMHVASLFGFREMATPIFEASEVFTRPLGETSDVVTKETYTFEDRGGRSLTLRPEGTAAIARALISNGLTQTLPQKFFYHGPMFRYERPQKGRMRQFHQIGVEWFGDGWARADAWVIHCAAMMLKQLGILKHCTLHINSLGDAKSRAAYRIKLVQYLAEHQNNLSVDSKRRLGTNPLRILDSKDEGDKEILKNAPRFDDYLDQGSKNYFDIVCGFLRDCGVEFIRDDKLVRGLDYYCHTTFEFITDELGAQGTVLGGGRYDGLVQTLGGPDIPGVGWAAGIERLSMLADSSPPLVPPIVIGPSGENRSEPSSIKKFKLVRLLREANIYAEVPSAHNMGLLLKRADRLNARLVVILGEDETKKDVATFRDMQSGEQWEVPFANVIDEVKNFISKTGQK